MLSRKPTLVVVALAVFATTVFIAGAVQTQQSATAASFVDPTGDFRKAPTAVTGENVYIAWWSNKTGNDEVLFRVHR